MSDRRVDAGPNDVSARDSREGAPRFVPQSGDLGLSIPTKPTE